MLEFLAAEVGLEDPHEVDAADSRRHRPERHPFREPEIDGLLLPVFDGPHSLGDGAIGQIGPHGGHRRGSDKEHEEWSHERSAANSRHADENADPESESDDQWRIKVQGILW